MAKVTSKFQVTVPKIIADRYKIRPGDEIEWSPAGDAICVTPRAQEPVMLDTKARLQLFDQATKRHRGNASRTVANTARSRGWSREDLYTRGRTH